MSHNTAIIARLTNIRKHNNADRLQCATVLGNQIIVGMTNVEDELGIYFDSNLQLSEEFAKANDLVRRKDADGNAAGGMFDLNRRVRTQKFRGEISDGFWIPISSLNFLKIKIALDEGTEFTELNGVPICNKYIVPGTKTHNQQMKKNRIAKSSIMFREHFDTEHFGKHLQDIDFRDRIVVTEKLHGCVKWDTVIDTLEHGAMQIKEIVDKKLDVKIKAFDTETNEIVYVPIDDYYTIQDEGDWYEIEMEDGSSITITGNNPVWLPELKCYRKVSDLSGSEKLLIDIN